MTLLEKLFKYQPKPPQAQATQLVTGSGFTLSAWNGNAYQNNIYRGATDAIARNAAKLKGSHVVQYGGKTQAEPGSRLNRLLQTAPNPHMNAYDMLYKLATHYYLHNNAFAMLQRDERGNVTGIYPMGAVSVSFLADPTGALYACFRFAGGGSVMLPYTEIVHLRRHFNHNDLLGDGNDAIGPALELAHAQNQGIISGIKSSTSIRGILHFSQILAPEKLKEEKDRFINDYLNISNEGGVAATDQKMEYTPIELKPAMIDAEQMAAAKAKIYAYLGISEKIVTSSYSEDEWAAFYESVVEPVALQLSLECTNKIFTSREYAFGHSIVFAADRLQFASNATKTKMITELMPLGVLSPNEARAILNLPPVEDGDTRFQTLNLVAVDIARQYQLSRTTAELTAALMKEAKKEQEDEKP